MTATGSTAFVVEIQALQKLLAEKDSQIERLKAQIAELCNFLEESERGWRSWKAKKLVAKARKAAE